MDTVFATNSMKINIKISNWPFNSVQNVLAVTFTPVALSNANPGVNSKSDDTGLRWVSMDSGNSTMYPFVVIFFFSFL